MNPMPTSTQQTAPAGVSEPFRSLIRTLGMLERVMQPYFARFGITGSQWAVLRVLQRAHSQGAGDLRLTDLGERLLIRLPSVTGVVDRLERMGLVARESSAEDLRVRRISLTSAGHKLVKRILVGHQAQIDTALGGLNTQEQAELQRLLTRLADHLEHMLDGSAPNEAGEPEPASTAAESGELKGTDHE